MSIGKISFGESLPLEMIRGYLLRIIDLDKGVFDIYVIYIFG